MAPPAYEKDGDVLPANLELYIRVNEHGFDAGSGMILPQAFRVPQTASDGMSVDVAEKRADPLATLGDRDPAINGVAMFQVGDVPAELPFDPVPPGAKKVQFRTEYAPLAENDAHAEVRAYQDGERTGCKAQRTVKHQYREALQSKAQWTIVPLSAQDPA